MRRKINTGTTLIELILYMTVLAVLLTSAFTIAFNISSDQTYVNNLTEQQYYSLAFAEKVRRLVMSSDSILSPSASSSSTILVTPEGSIKNKNNMNFIRDNGRILNTNILLLLRGTTTKEISIPSVLQ